MKFDILLLDANSIINFTRYYHKYFSFYDVKAKKHKFEVIFNDLMNFLIKKVKSGEIVILDKVNDELLSRDLNEFKEGIKNSIMNSLIVFDEVVKLIDKYRIIENEKIIGDKDKINAALELYETKHADLFLIAYANKLKSEGKKVLLITEEKFGKDGKLIPKIPVICKRDNENIYCRNVPFALFEFYKEELEFSLNINHR